MWHRSCLERFVIAVLAVMVLKQSGSEIMERGWFPKGSVARPTVGRATRSPFFAFIDNHETWSKTDNNYGIR